MTGEALRNLKDTSDSICCLLGPHVSLPRYLHLGHRPLPLRLFLGGVQPGGLCLPGSKELHPPHDSLAVAIKGKTRLKPIICVTLWLFFTDLNYGFPGAEDKYFVRWKNTQWRVLAPSHAIYIPALHLALRELWHTSMFLLTKSFCFFGPLEAKPRLLPSSCSSPVSWWPSSNNSVELLRLLSPARQAAFHHSVMTEKVHKSSENYHPPDLMKITISHLELFSTTSCVFSPLSSDSLGHTLQLPAESRDRVVI